jgi:hypothetical protein
MTFDEYKSNIMDLIKDPDTALTKVDGLFKELQGDLETKASVEAKVAEQDERIRTLQDTNMKLFLKASGEPEKEPEPEQPKTIEEKFDELVKESANE